MSRLQILKCALPLIPSHGFTRNTLASAAMSLAKPHDEPLSDTALNSLFGSGDSARRALIDFWLEEGINDMKAKKGIPLNALLKHRLCWNEPVIPHLPEAFALMASPLAGPPIDPGPALWHAASVADEACFLSGDQSTGASWYVKRLSVSAAYLAAELHQLSSPKTADEFLDSLLEASHTLGSSASDTTQFVQFVGRSWLGIGRSLGLT